MTGINFIVQSKSRVFWNLSEVRSTRHVEKGMLLNSLPNVDFIPNLKVYKYTNWRIQSETMWHEMCTFFSFWEVRGVKRCAGLLHLATLERFMDYILFHTLYIFLYVQKSYWENKHINFGVLWLMWKEVSQMHVIPTHAWHCILNTLFI